VKVKAQLEEEIESTQVSETAAFEVKVIGEPPVAAEVQSKLIATFAHCPGFKLDKVPVQVAPLQETVKEGEEEEMTEQPLKTL